MKKCTDACEKCSECMPPSLDTENIQLTDKLLEEIILNVVHVVNRSYEWEGKFSKSFELVDNLREFVMSKYKK
jgi:hypothetical protein